jgi:hypothetical protein
LQKPSLTSSAFEERGAAASMKELDGPPSNWTPWSMTPPLMFTASPLMFTATSPCSSWRDQVSLSLIWLCCPSCHILEHSGGPANHDEVTKDRKMELGLNEDCDHALGENDDKGGSFYRRK